MENVVTLCLFVCWQNAIERKCIVKRFKWLNGKRIQTQSWPCCTPKTRSRSVDVPGFTARQKTVENQTGPWTAGPSRAAGSSGLLLAKAVGDCCECFIFKYTHALTVQWMRNFRYCMKRSWMRYWTLWVHCTVSACVYLKTKHEPTVSNSFNIQFEVTAGDWFTMASRLTCLNEKTMN